MGGDGGFIVDRLWRCQNRTMRGTGNSVGRGERGWRELRGRQRLGFFFNEEEAEETAAGLGRSHRRRRGKNRLAGA
jgi:hypothetical protein